MMKLPVYILWLILLVIMPLSTAEVQAHALKFGVFNIVEEELNFYRISFSYSGTGDNPSSAQLIFPDYCAESVVSMERHKTNLIKRVFSLNCDQPILKGRIGISGISETGVQVMLLVAELNGTKIQSMLSEKSWTINLSKNKSTLQEGSVKEKSGSTMASAFIRLGVEHILSGFDHLLFLLGLIILVGLRRKLIWVITFFTIGHGITVFLVSFDALVLSVPPVEALIALSIVLLASECITKSAKSEDDLSFTQRMPQYAALGFGLIHGLGFAGGLLELGVAQSNRLASVLFFNLGIEIGQILFFILAVLGALIVNYIVEILKVKAKLKLKVNRAACENGLSYVIGVVGAFWFFERTMAMLGSI